MKMILFFICFICLVGCGSLQTTTAINSYPQGARVFVDGQYVGVTPISVDLEGNGYTDARTVRAEPVTGGEPQEILVNRGYTWLEGYKFKYWTSFVIFDFRQPPGRMAKIE